MFDPDKWAEDVVGRLKESSEKQREHQEAFTERRKLLRQEAPTLWPKLQAAFQKLCDSFNKRQNVLLLNASAPGMLLVRRTDAANPVVTVVQDAASHNITVSASIGRYKEVYGLAVIEDGIGSVTYVKDSMPINPEEIALDAMNAFFGIRS